MKRLLFSIFLVMCCMHMVNAQTWYYDEFRPEEISNDKTPYGGVMVNCALEGDMAKFQGYGDSTVVKKKDASIEASIAYSAEMLGDGDQMITGFYSFCMFRRVDPGTSEDLHIKDLFAFYYKTEPDEDWIEFPVSVEMEEVAFPGGWTRSAVIGASLGNIEASDFKFVMKDKTFEGSGDNWSAYIGKTGVYTGEALDIDLTKQYSLSTMEDKYWVADGDDDEGYMVRQATEAVAGTKSAWVFVKHDNDTYTIKTADDSKELAFDMEYGKWNNNLWMGFLMERSLDAAAPYENHKVKSTYLIGKNLDGTYSFCRAQDGRLVGKAENKNEECISVCRPEADYARNVTLTAIGTATGTHSMEESQLMFATSGQELAISGLEGNNSISVYSIVGTAVVLNDRVSSSSASYTLAPGVYVVSVLSESGIVNRKVVIK